MRARHRWKLFGGIKGSVAHLREQTSPKGHLVGIVCEERFDLKPPYGLGTKIKEIFVKHNSILDVQGTTLTSEGWRPGGTVLVIVFRDMQTIMGLPVTEGRVRKYRKMAYTHVAINRMPKSQQSSEENDWAIAFYRHKAGRIRDNEKSGELALEVQDELSVLQWLFENGLEELTEISTVQSWKLLPKTDSQREAENAIAAQAQTLGFGMQQHPEKTFHFFRLLKRIAENADGEITDDVKTAYANTVIGGRKVTQLQIGGLSPCSFYYSKELKVCYALYTFPEWKYVVRIDIEHRKTTCEPMKTGIDGEPQWVAYHNFLTSAGFQKIPYDAFASLVGGIGTLTNR